MVKEEEKIVYYTPTKIKKYEAEYNIIYGERSNGKTTGVIIECLEQFCKSKYQRQMAIIRRFDEDIKGKQGGDIMNVINKHDYVEKFTKNEYNSIEYNSRKFYLVRRDDSGNITKTLKTPFAHAFSLTAEEHYKMRAFPDIKNILFDEFISRTSYLPDEFITFCNLLSTIIRLRDDVTIWMCGNTRTKMCPYFNEMGLKNVKNQKRGTIDLYEFDKLKIAVEFSDFSGQSKKSNKYFAFDNPKLKMITEGAWELAIYPHLPVKYKPKDVLTKFFVSFDGDILQGNVVNVDDSTFVYIHRKTTPIQEDNTNLVFTPEESYKSNYRRNILKPYGMRDSKIAELMFKRDKVFYQDNEIGEIMNNYIKWCRQTSIIKQ